MSTTINITDILNAGEGIYTKLNLFSTANLPSPVTISKIGEPYPADPIFDTPFLNLYTQYEEKQLNTLIPTGTIRFITGPTRSLSNENARIMGWDDYTSADSNSNNGGFEFKHGGMAFYTVNEHYDPIFDKNEQSFIPSIKLSGKYKSIAFGDSTIAKNQFQIAAGFLNSDTGGDSRYDYSFVVGNGFLTSSDNIERSNLFEVLPKKNEVNITHGTLTISGSLGLVQILAEPALMYGYDETGKLISEDSSSVEIPIHGGLGPKDGYTGAYMFRLFNTIQTPNNTLAEDIIGNGYANQYSSSFSNLLKGYYVGNSPTMVIYTTSSISLNANARVFHAGFRARANNGQSPVHHQNQLSPDPLWPQQPNSPWCFPNARVKRTFPNGSAFYEPEPSAEIGGVSLLTGGRIVAPEFVAIRDILSVSDSRKKSDIQEIELKDALDLVNKIKPITFKWNNTDKYSSGYIAQDFYKNGFDHLINFIPNTIPQETDNEGFVSPENLEFSLSYNGIIPYHGAVIKYLLEKITQLESEINILKNS